MKQRGEEKIRFDAAVGRNALYRESDKAGGLTRLAGVLKPDGLVSLAEVVPSQGMRLSELLDLESETAVYRKRLAEAEENIYADPGNPLVNWTAEDFTGLLHQAGFEVLKSECRRFADRRLIRNEDIERWFASRGGSYADRASPLLSSSALERLRKICEGQLSGREVDWRSTMLFVCAAKKG
jgi:putative ATPase